MDRVQFIGAAVDPDMISSNTIVQYFDHTMAAYNIVGSCSNIFISSSVNSSLCMTFDVIFEDSTQAETMYIRLLKNNRIEIYGKVFNVQSHLNDKKISLRINQVAA